MSKTAVNITFPPGRLVGGSLYTSRTTDPAGNPLVVKSGPNKGQPREDFYFAVAYPKNGTTHWSATSWGAPIWAAGHGYAPAHAGLPSFAWKIEDGDSVVPNKKGNKPCDNEGWPGHWVVKFGGGFAPECYQLLPGTAKPSAFPQKDGIQPGDIVEVAGSIDSNRSSDSPGIYVNHHMVCLRGYHPDGRIVYGRNVEEAGFGQGGLPEGTSAVPVGQAFAPPPAPGAVAAPPIPAAAPKPAAPPPPVKPDPAFLNPPAKVMTAKAAGATYQSFVDAGWDDAAMIREGYLQA